MNLSDIYRGITRVSVGAGDVTLFWKDMLQDRMLETTYPRAFSYARYEDTSVATFLSMTSLGEGFHVPVSQQATEEIREMQAITLHTTLGGSIHGSWTCVWGDKYSARKYYAFYFKDV